MRYFVIAGEASGDLHASNLIKQLKITDTEAVFAGWGGEMMRAQGCDILKDYRELAFMGFVEVISNINKILKNLSTVKTQILAFKPDAVILIDYPGFNLRIAKFCKTNNLKTIYYISPQIWAWHKSRIKIIKQYIDKMFVILPFEKEFYAKHNYNAEYFGHPLVDVINNHKQSFIGKDKFIEKNKLENKEIIAVLPGSRKQEINNMLPQMKLIAKELPQYQFIVAATNSINKELYLNQIKNTDVKIVYNQTYDLLLSAKAAIVTSGTATLETALLYIPEIVCYKGSYISYIIAKKLINLKYISLVNIIMDKNVVKELIQQEMNAQNIKTELEIILNNQKKQEEIIKDYKELSLKLGEGKTSEMTAKAIFNFLNKT